MTTDPEPAFWSDRAIAIAEILQPLRVFGSRIPTSAMEQARTALIPLYKGKRPSDDTVRNLLKRLEADGIHGLERAQHKDYGASTLNPLLVQYIRDLLINKRWSKQRVVEAARKYANDTLGITAPVPTYDQVLFIDQRIPADLKTLGRYGEKVYRQHHELVVRFEAEYANQLWQADNHLLDIFVVNEHGGKPYRPWMSAFLDDYSRAIPGYALSRYDPGSKGIALAYHHALLASPERNWLIQGIPDAVYFDHGKDFLSKHIKAVCLHLGIYVMVHEPYHPESKGKIERWFRTLEEQCLSTLDGYCGKIVHMDRPRPSPKARYTLAELVAIITDWIIKTYHHKRHSEIKTTPHKRWLASAQERLIKTIDARDDHSLDFLLKPISRVVGAQGIRYLHRDYEDAEGKLGRIRGQTVTVYVDPDHTDRLFVHSTQSAIEKPFYICTASVVGINALNNADRRKVAQLKQERRAPRVAEVRASKQRLAETERASKRAKAPRKTATVNPATVSERTEVTNAPSATVAHPQSPPVVRRLWEILGDDADGF